MFSEDYDTSFLPQDFDVSRGISSSKVDSYNKILLVGDQATYLSEYIADLEYHIIAYKNTYNAYNWLVQKSQNPINLPDAIICDLNVLQNNAYILFEILQGNSKLKSIPFVIISKNHTIKDKIKALETGIDDFYSLPFNAQDLIQRIKFLKEFKKERNELVLTNDKPKNQYFPILKRSFDIIFAVMAIIILSPLFALIILAIKIENKGPVFYFSKRAGADYRIFNFYKFRSMVQDADKNLKDLSHLNQYKDKVDNIVFSDVAFVKIDNDPRITPLGKLLRNSSMDELPQLFNVLKGDMSIVGNRPLPLYEAEQLTKDVWAKRFLAPAGITGLWQVTKRGNKNMSVEERINLDIDYANRASILFDFKIILKTFPSLWQKDAV